MQQHQYTLNISQSSSCWSTNNSNHATKIFPPHEISIGEISSLTHSIFWELWTDHQCSDKGLLVNLNPLCFQERSHFFQERNEKLYIHRLPSYFYPETDEALRFVATQRHYDERLHTPSHFHFEHRNFKIVTFFVTNFNLPKFAFN